MSHINRIFRNIYIHIPKTAGRNMERHDFIRGSGHLSLQQLSQDDNFDESYIKWTFVRNPHERLISAFFYVNKKWLTDFYKIIFNKNIEDEWEPVYSNKFRLPQYHSPVKEFYNFVNNLYEYKDNFFEAIKNPPFDGFASYFIHFYPMYYFVEHETVELDFIGRFENIQEDWLTVKDMIRDNIRSPRSKKLITNAALGNAPKGVVSIPENFNDPEIIKKIQEIFKKDYEFFSY